MVDNSDWTGFMRAVALTGVGVLLGVAVTYSTGVASNRTEIVRLATKVDALTISIQNGMGDRYTATDAARDNAVLSEKIGVVSDRTLDTQKEVRDHLRGHPK